MGLNNHCNHIIGRKATMNGLDGGTDFTVLSTEIAVWLGRIR